MVKGYPRASGGPKNRILEPDKYKTKGISMAPDLPDGTITPASSRSERTTA